MNKLEEKMVRAIQNGKNFLSGNTEVFHKDGVTRVYLHNNLIAIKNKLGKNENRFYN